jgi:succinyl-CoA synthetase beta subunit
MDFVEHAGKSVLRGAGIETPRGILAATPDEAADAAAALGPCVVKAQVPTGKRGKAGGIRLAATAEAAREAARAILGMTIGEHRVETVLVEQQVPIAAEMYAAVLNDPASKAPLLLFSAEGGMDIEEIAGKHPGQLVRLPIDIRSGVDADALTRALPAKLPCEGDKLVDLLIGLYAVYADSDAELVEINPLIATRDGRLVALDCKLAMDDSAVPRRLELAGHGTPETLTPLEAQAKALGLKFIELDGTVGVLANGAGLTMTVMTPSAITSVRANAPQKLTSRHFTRGLASTSSRAGLALV